jgi:AcrR family transcriptional regulator
VSALERPLRRDAERNRRRILDAAREVFAERGLGVSLDDVARRAGVGIGTVYRRFPDKEQLVDALFEQRLDAMAALAEEAAAQEDPWAALVAFIERALEEQAADRGLKQLLLSSGEPGSRTRRVRERVKPHLEALVARAQAAGALRADVAAQDLPLLQIMLSGVTDCMGPDEPELWRRYLAVFLDGLRAHPREPSPLPVGPPDDARVELMLRSWRPPAR